MMLQERGGNNMEWHTINEKPTNEKAQYLLIMEFGIHKFYRLARYTDSYQSLSKFSFEEEDGGGFYTNDSEWGFVIVSDYLLWSELPEIPQCFEPID